MILVHCPHCDWPLIVPARCADQWFECHNCIYTFCPDHVPQITNADLLVPVLSMRIRDRLPRGAARAAPPPALAPPPPEPPRQRPRLVVAHACTNCGHALGATGQRRTTLNCPDCQKRTSVYAIQYHCPECDLLLEVPASMHDRMARCPGCSDQHTVPSDLLFNDAREPVNERWFAAQCPRCSVAVECPPQAADRTLVCPACLRVFKGPPGGGRLMLGPLPHGEPLGGELSLQRPCRRCGLRIPLGTETCPYCGSDRR